MRRLGALANISLAILCILALQLAQVCGVYVPLREYAGSTFFDGWDYWGNVDNTTWGNVTFLDQADAVAHGLTYINGAQNAIIKVDNTTTIASAPLVNRDSIRITTKDSYGVGTLWIIDALHLPYGCSVWPSFWTLGANVTWPDGGEIDIIEGINMMGNNQIALHSTPGCAIAPNASQRQSGTVLQGDCSVDQGCIVAETKPNSYGSGFAAAGGGVWALQMDVSGVFVWFWSRPDVPASIQSANSTSSMDAATFGMPTASYPASGCNITEFFAPQQLVLLITLCGVWAGVPSIYSSTCPGSCVANNVIGTGSNYADAYFEISYLRTYIMEDLVPATTATTSSVSGVTAATTDTATTAASNGGRWKGTLGLGWLVVVLVGGAAYLNWLV